MNPPDPADIILGTAHPPYPHPQFRLAPREQAFHGLIWGSTGTGKSKLLQSLFLQHLNKGRGVCLIDPHGDLSRGCLAYLTAKGFFKQEEAAEKLVYLDFGAGGPVPFNVLNTPHDPHTRALNALEALTRTWPDLQGAPLFRTLFLSAAMVLVENDLVVPPVRKGRSIVNIGKLHAGVEDDDLQAVEEVRNLIAVLHGKGVTAGILQAGVRRHDHSGDIRAGVALWKGNALFHLRASDHLQGHFVGGEHKAEFLPEQSWREGSTRLFAFGRILLG